MNTRLPLLLLLLLLGGCQTVPAPLQGQFDSLNPAEAAQLANGARVRWAGLIHKTRNERTQTCLLVIGLPQKSSGRPRTQAEPQGRFEACMPRFLDPAIHASGRAITITGRLQRMEERLVGEYPLSVPVVAMEGYVLWPPEAEIERETIFLFDPWWPDLWFHRHHHHNHGHERPMRPGAQH